MTKIVVLDGHTLNPGDNSWRELEELAELSVYPRTRIEDLQERARDADIVLTNKTPLRAWDFEQLPRLKFISVLATGFNVVDTMAAKRRGIPVSNVPSYGTASVAQHVMALLLELTNHVGAHALSVKAGDWERCPDFCYWNKSTVELSGRTMGIVGFGRIGRQVALLAHAFGMRIICASRSPRSLADIAVEHVSLERLFSEADIVTLHCSQTPENIGFVNAALLGRMKSGAFLINTARGTLVNEADLEQALRNGTLAAAALDVLSIEPPARRNSLSDVPNCLITPHVAWSSLEARRRLMHATVENVRAYLNGQPQNVVNS